MINITSLRFIIVLLFMSLCVLNPSLSQKGKTLVVNTTDDLDDGVCDEIHCSLREAMNAAINHPGPDLILFDSFVFPPGGNAVIKPLKELPYIYYEGTTIDATGADVTIDGSELTRLSIESHCFHMVSSSRNVIKGLRIQKFPLWAIGIHAFMGEANYNTLIDLVMLNNGYGLAPYTGRSDAIFICTNTDGINTGGNKACYNRIINCVIEGTADDGVIIQVRDGGECNNNIIFGNILRDNAEDGIEIDAAGSSSKASMNVVVNNKISGHQYPGSLTCESSDGGRAENNIFLFNDISGGYDRGIWIGAYKGGGTTGNKFFHNIVRTHAKEGIYLREDTDGFVKNTHIRGNTVKNNKGVGIKIMAAKNFLYHNNVVHNKAQASDEGFQNRWDYKGQGNYWSDYKGQDSDGDGIGDTPYTILPNGEDRFPLINKYKIKKPNHPIKLNAQYISGEKVGLKWKDMSKNEDGFEIHRKEKLGKTWEWVPLAWTPSNVRNYEDTTIESGAFYKYRVRAYNAGGYSHYSNLAKVKTKNK